MKDYKLKQRNLRASHTLGSFFRSIKEDCFHCGNVIKGPFPQWKQSSWIWMLCVTRSPQWKQTVQAPWFFLYCGKYHLSFPGPKTNSFLFSPTLTFSLHALSEQRLLTTNFQRCRGQVRSPRNWTRPQTGIRRYSFMAQTNYTQLHESLSRSLLLDPSLTLSLSISECVWLGQCVVICVRA